MKKVFIISAVFALMLSFNSCRETEMNTDGKMEEHETRQGELEDES